MLDAKVLEKIDAYGDCWEWTGAINYDGYGTHWLDKTQLAHRVVYEQLVGPIPEHLQCDHLCRNRSCVNPDHIDLVTVKENTQRGFRAKKTYCPNGHPYSGDNLYINKGKRYCKVCRNEGQRRHQAKKRGQLT